MEGVVRSRKPPCKRDSDQCTSKGRKPSAKRRRTSDWFIHKGRKPRLGGSLSDPLNLEVWSDDNECSTCAPSPAERDRNLGDQSRIPLPQELHHDPLNLEEKITDFETLVETFVQIQPPNRQSGGGSTIKDRYKRKQRKRRKSRSDSNTSVSDTNQLNHTSSSSSSEKSFNPKAALYRYGNYDRYYGYRNSGSLKEDPRLKLLNSEWFKGKRCLDIGSNTGQVTIQIGRFFKPEMITGIDIDTKLVRIASKNLQRTQVPSKMPDGRFVPQSVLMSFGPIDWLEKVGGAVKQDEREFPHNVRFLQGNYVPWSEEDLIKTCPEYDVILCLSVTKWVHLNWGDTGLKRMFRKMYLNLRPGGQLILEPQPWVSYSRRKKINAEILENYQSIKFLPDQFHSYLLSPEVGFTSHQAIGISSNTNPGFQRPIHVYFKEITPAEKPHPLIPNTASTTQSVSVNSSNSTDKHVEETQLKT